jgi:rubredoxin
MLDGPDAWIAAGTAFTEIPEDWDCSIGGTTKKSFVPYAEIITA